MYPTVKQVEDRELTRRILHTLCCHGILEVESRNVRVAGGVVTIRGQFPSERERWVCLEFCRHVAGVLRVVDQCQVGMALATI